MWWRSRSPVIWLVSCVGGLVLLGSSGGVGTFQREDRTGSPLSLNSTCGTCHFGGNFQSRMEIQVFKDSQPVRTYLPNTLYQVRVAIVSQRPAATHGMQLVAMQGPLNQQAGSFVSLPTSIRAVELWNRVYLEQSRPQKSGEFVISWRSPDKDLGTVHFHVTGLASNEDNSSSGDSPVQPDQPFTLSGSGVTSAKGLTRSQNKLLLRADGFGGGYVWETNLLGIGGQELMIFDLAGRQFLKQWATADASGQGVHIPRLPAGFYILTLTGREGVISGAAYFP